MEKRKQTLWDSLTKTNLNEILEGQAGRTSKSFTFKLIMTLIVTPLTWIFLQVLGGMLLVWVLTGFGMFIIVPGFIDGYYIVPSLMLLFNLLLLAGFINQLKREHDEENQ